MSNRLHIFNMRLWLLAAAVAAPASAEDAAAIVRRSVEVDQRYLELVRQYTFIERQENRQLDDHGKVKSRESRTWDLTLLEGSPYRRLVAHDDKPLSPKEEEKEQEKLRRSIEGRQKETPEQRQARLADARRRAERQREPFKEIVDAFDLRVAGEDTVSGRKAWIIEALPRRSYRPRARIAQFFPKVRGKLWICQSDYQWVKVEAESVETISFGAILARVAKGARIRIEQTRVNGEVWLPLRIDIAATARIALFKVFRGQVELTYRDYRKFQAESKIVATEAR